jgi:hypothetical protein
MATAASKALPTVARGGLHIGENFPALLAKGLDEVFARTFSFPFEGEKLYEKRTTNQDTVRFQSVIGIGNIAQNRDTDVIPHDEKQQGFAHTITTVVYRGRVGIEKTLRETEQYGMIGDLQQELADASRRTVELILADGVNRALGASGAPFLCEDGMYWIDGSRPQPYPLATADAAGTPGEWDNSETASAITPTSIYNAQINAAQHRSERGHLDPRTVEQLYVRPTDEKAVWEILRSDLRPTDSMNARNFQFGRFQYTVLKHMTTAQILYRLDGQNEVMMYWRVQPEFKTWDGADNPDITYQRVRFALGTGAKRPDSWRGGTVS